MLFKIFRRILFQFQPEAAHQIAMKAMRLIYDLQPMIGARVIRFLFGPICFASKRAEISTKSTNCLGLDFLNGVGLAGGFDKNGEYIELWPLLGFGFCEIGTVTPRPQPGNPRPRLWRDRGDDLKTEAIINRMGFNNLGATLIAENLKQVRVRGSLPENFRVGVNIGKNKETPNDQAKDDYRLAVRPFLGLVDFVVVNVSSPNTPGLRDLQSVQSMRDILKAIRNEMDQWSSKKVVGTDAKSAIKVPILVKIAPEVEGERLRELVESLEGENLLDGWVATNTLQVYHEGGPAGRSGKPLSERSREVLEQLRFASKLPIISVGGIDNGDEMDLRRKLGATLVEVYTGYVYRGPLVFRKS